MNVQDGLNDIKDKIVSLFDRLDRMAQEQWAIKERLASLEKNSEIEQLKSRIAALEKEKWNHV